MDDQAFRRWILAHWRLIVLVDASVILFGVAVAGSPQVVAGLVLGAISGLAMGVAVRGK